MAWTAGDDERTDWATPPEVYAELDAEFHFDLDPCSSDDNRKCAQWFTEADDGLAQQWAPATVFMNPPYGREIKDWMYKARAEADKGATVVCLIPARLDAIWWNVTTCRSEVRNRFGRINFIGGHAAFPGPIAVVVMRPDDPRVSSPARGEWRVTLRPPILDAEAW